MRKRKVFSLALKDDRVEQCPYPITDNVPIVWLILSYD